MTPRRLGMWEGGPMSGRGYYVHENMIKAQN